MQSKPRILVIIGSTRPGRFGENVAKWFYELAAKRDDLEVELIDLATANLPLLDEPAPPIAHQYTKPHTKDWAAKIAQFDGFVFVTPEYNHSVPAALKNAIDYLYQEWNNKAAGFVSYGASAGGVRAVEHLRLSAAELQMVTVREQVLINLHQDVDENHAFKPNQWHEQSASGLLDQLVAWSMAFKSVRENH